MSVLNSLANPSQRWTVPVKGCTLISPKMVIPSFSPTVKWLQITNGSTRTQNHASSNLSLHSGITLPISQLTVQSKVSPAHWLTPTIFHLAPHRAINYLPLEDHMECPKYKQKKSKHAFLWVFQSRKLCLAPTRILFFKWSNLACFFLLVALLLWFIWMCDCVTHNLVENGTGTSVFSRQTSAKFSNYPGIVPGAKFWVTSITFLQDLFDPQMGLANDKNVQFFARRSQKQTTNVITSMCLNFAPKAASLENRYGPTIYKGA